MKIYILTLIILMTIISSCYEPIPGSGIIVEQERDLPQFIAVENQCMAKVFIQSGSTQLVKVKTDDNFIESIKASVKNQTLVISSESIISPSVLEIYIEMSDISQLELSGSGNITINEDFEQKVSLWLLNSGSGNISLNTCISKELEIYLSGSGNISINDIDVGTNTNIRNSGSGNVEIKSGRTLDYFALLSGSGSINTSSFVSQKCIASNSGSGSINLRAETTLDATITGSGSINYWGNPTITQNITGSGKLRKKD